MPNDGPPEGYITSADACTRLGISDRTLRRRVAAGTIEGEYLPRPQGSVLYVRLPADTAPRGNAVSDSEMNQAADNTAAAPETPQDVPGAAERALELLAAALTEERAERQQATAENADLRERAGRAEAERDALRARLEAAEAERDRLRSRSWWRWWG